jgi:hypothetical protein
MRVIFQKVDDGLPETPVVRVLEDVPPITRARKGQRQDLTDVSSSSSSGSSVGPLVMALAQYFSDRTSRTYEPY